MNPKTVLILAAGLGRRMGPFSRMINKSLVPYNNRALISHVMDQWPDNTRYVIALGHMAQQVRDYVEAVHADRDIMFVDVNDYAEGATGPATSILACRAHLPDDFFWITCDTLFDFDYTDLLDHSWIGVGPVDSTVSADYCWVRRNGNQIMDVKNKQSSAQAVDAFIGLMYVHGPQYLDNLAQRSAREAYEGFAGLDLQAYTVAGWKDFGTWEKWSELNADQVTLCLPKPNEIFYADSGRVIKFFQDPEQAARRQQRAAACPEAMPRDLRVQGNFLVHAWVPGDVMYAQLTPDLFDRFLAWCEHTLWREQPQQAAHQRRLAAEFYRGKTLDRLDQLRVKYLDWSEPLTVNGRAVQGIDLYLDRLDWVELIEHTSWTFIHGDLQFDNIIYDPEQDGFTCIDWRTDFAGDVQGDVYYDLAKCLAGIYFNHRRAKQLGVVYEESQGTAHIGLCPVDLCDVYVERLRSWVEQHGLRWSKVRALVPVIYVNMSPLHAAPLDKYLLALAQWHFAELMP